MFEQSRSKVKIACEFLMSKTLEIRRLFDKVMLKTKGTYRFVNTMYQIPKEFRM